MDEQNVNQTMSARQPARQPQPAQRSSEEERALRSLLIAAIVLRLSIAGVAALGLSGYLPLVGQTLSARLTVLPAGVPLFPDIAVRPSHYWRRPPPVTGRIRVRRREAEHLTQVDEVLLACGALLGGASLPFLRKLGRRHGHALAW